MSKQTAMQEMHDWLNDKWSDPSKLISCLEVMDKIEELLHKEKEQIVDAHGVKHKKSIKQGVDFWESTNGEQYYNETYTNGTNRIES
jgi:hypothetical protein